MVFLPGQHDRGVGRGWRTNWSVNEVDLNSWNPLLVIPPPPYFVHYPSHITSRSWNPLLVIPPYFVHYPLHISSRSWNPLLVIPPPTLLRSLSLTHIFKVLESSVSYPPPPPLLRSLSLTHIFKVLESSVSYPPPPPPPLLRSLSLTHIFKVLESSVSYPPPYFVHYPSHISSRFLTIYCSPPAIIITYIQ